MADSSNGSPECAGLTDNQGKVITCRAAVFWEKDKPAAIETLEVRVPDDHEVRIKMVATGICFSDISSSKGLFGPFPLIVGHEGVGLIESVGAKVTALKAGDPVIPLWAFQCKECRWCKIGSRNFCLASKKFRDTRSVIICKGKPVRPISGLGLFAEYVVLDQRCALKIKPVPHLERVAMYGCCLPTGYGAAVNAAKVFPGAICAIWGLGPIGLSAVLGCKAAGAERIIGINRRKEKFALGEAFGCTECISPLDHEGPLSKVLKDMTDGYGPDFVFVCVGDKAVIEEGVEACRSNGGECIVVGVDPLNSHISINNMDLIFGKSIKGTMCGDCLSEQMEKLVNDYREGKIPSDSLITGTLPLESINEGFDDVKAGKTIRTIIKF